MKIDPRAVMQELQLPLAAPGAEGGRRLSLQFQQKSSYSLPELLAYSGEDFIDVAYQAVLRRLPDEEGRNSYLSAMEQGQLSKVEIIGQLRSSPEGFNAGTVIHGLRLTYLLRRLRRKRGGSLLGFAISLLRLNTLQPRIEAAETRLAARDDLAERRAAVALGGLRDELRQQISASAHLVRKSVGRSEGEAARRMDALTRRLDDMETANASRQADMLGELVQRISQLVGGGKDASSTKVASGATDDELSAMYVRLEQAFRGSHEEIRRRGEIYLPYIAEAAAATDCNKVLDLGCGRGELLALLGDYGYSARGIDLNPIFIEENLNAGRDAALVDALTALECCEPESLAAITSIHLVEHLPVDVLVRLMDLALRALRPGGRLILETPNPQNLRTSAYYFYFDPTHRNPLPPPLLSWMAGDRGFADVKVDMLDDGRFTPETSHIAHEAVGADPINRFVDWLSVSPDYAIIGVKP